VSAEQPKPTRPAPALVGRIEEVARLRDVLSSANHDGQALLISGEPGVGKSMLLQAAEHLAADAGVRVLKATGSQFEADISYAGLHQLLFPLLDTISVLPDWQRQALEAALGLAKGSRGNELAICNAALALLVRASESTPLVLLVDDIPWLDHASAAVLGFIARRLAGQRIAFIAAERTGETSYFERSGLDTLDLQPLNLEDSTALVANRYPALSVRVRQRLVRESEGNPLALLELPAALEGHPDHLGLADVLPLGRKLERIFGERVDVLPDETREVLLVAALDGTNDLQPVERIARQWGEHEALAPAVRAGLVTIDAGNNRLTFRHPLIRSAIVERSSPTQRRRVHRLLAHHRQSQLERHAWHLAQAAEGPDDAVAEMLAQVGHANLMRGDSVGAISELLRAAELSASGNIKAIRLAEAAYLGATVTGDLDDVPALLNSARRADPDAQRTLEGAVAGAHLLLNGHGDIPRAHSLLTGAISTYPDASNARHKPLLECIYTLSMVCFFSNNSQLWQAADRAVAALRPHPPRMIAATAALLGNPTYTAHDHLPLLESLLADLDHETSPARITRIATAAAYVDRLPDCREALWRAVQHGREGGAVTSAIEALLLIANGSYFSGEWDDVIDLTAEALALCEEHGYVLYQHPAWFLRGLVHAARGQRVPALELADSLDEWSRPRQVNAVRAYATHIRSTLHMASGDFPAAFEAVRGFAGDGTLPAHVPHALWLLLDIVESAVRSGHPDLARTVTNATIDLNLPRVSTRLALVAAACRGLTADDTNFAEHLEAGLAGEAATRWPIDLARTQLIYGERLRRVRRTGEARVHLAAAHDTFRRLGATPWVTRAEHELRAAGHPATATTATPASTNALSPQQLEIAQLAASGLTNKQIGERLYLSHRTIGTHLYAIFPKLGITSRAALRDALRNL
jgi:DNA-binding CsgD family transcriptional regulator